jgi:small subunit ribosomal protein S6
MFLLDGSSSDFEAAARPIRTVLDRNEVEILGLKPWDERRLAYEIKGRRRGLYALVYFNADPERVKEIEHDCQLSEEILRILVLHKDHLSEEELAAETPATAAAKRAAQAPPRQQSEQPLPKSETETETETKQAPQGKEGETDTNKKDAEGADVVEPKDANPPEQTKEE